LWATPERQLSFDLRDFDETLRGPFEWDVKRYLASLVVMARDNGLPGSASRRDWPNARDGARVPARRAS
jgi:uncharacterized protein (DUF2252 family)